LCTLINRRVTKKCSRGNPGNIVIPLAFRINSAGNWNYYIQSKLFQKLHGRNWIQPGFWLTLYTRQDVVVLVIFGKLARFWSFSDWCQISVRRTLPHTLYTVEENKCKICLIFLVSA
jgi:hypothetical protein